MSAHASSTRSPICWRHCPEGLHKTASKPGGVALDFIRGNLMQPWELKPLPLSAAGPDNDLNEKIDAYVQRAMSDEDAMIYAFGETWGPENNKADKYFGFKPGRGIHDIHFNQGNPPGAFAAQNGPWQDGGLILQFPREDQWVAAFLKFQSQAWHSDDGDGSTDHPAGSRASGRAACPDRPQPHPALRRTGRHDPDHRRLCERRAVT